MAKFKNPSHKSEQKRITFVPKIICNGSIILQIDKNSSKHKLQTWFTTVLFIYCILLIKL